MGVDGDPASTAGRGGGEGVRTRDHLASIRTYLAWVRIGITLVTLGYVMGKFRIVLDVVHGRAAEATPAVDRAAALATAAIGVLLTSFAFLRLLTAGTRIERSDLRTHAILDVGLMLAAFVAGVVIVVYVLTLG